MTNQMRRYANASVPVFKFHFYLSKREIKLSKLKMLAGTMRMLRK